MKEDLMLLVADLRDQDIDLQETPALFKWSYQEEPHIEFQLLVKEVDQMGLPFSTTTH